MEHGGLCGSIDDLFVRPRFWRHGVTRAVMEELLCECQRRGFLAVQVETASDDVAAQTLYGRCGLQLRGDKRETFSLRLDKATNGL